MTNSSEISNLETKKGNIKEFKISLSTSIISTVFGGQFVCIKVIWSSKTSRSSCTSNRCTKIMIDLSKYLAAPTFKT
jgi:hypothetical protein